MITKAHERKPRRYTRIPVCVHFFTLVYIISIVCVIAASCDTEHFARWLLTDPTKDLKDDPKGAYLGRSLSPQRGLLHGRGSPGDDVRQGVSDHNRGGSHRGPLRGEDKEMEITPQLLSYVSIVVRVISLLILAWSIYGLSLNFVDSSLRSMSNHLQFGAFVLLIILVTMFHRGITDRMYNVLLYSLIVMIILESLEFFLLRLYITRSRKSALGFI